MQALKEHLGKHQLKLTRQRELILNAFLRQEHITAEAMYHQLAKSDPHLGLATIYRTLNLFCDAGLAQARHFGSQTKYDNVSHKGHHDHLICTGCEKNLKTKKLSGSRKKWPPGMDLPSRPTDSSSTDSVLAAVIDAPAFF
jgi:Fe2+ or Zn2+ uptake regulation protein